MGYYIDLESVSIDNYKTKIKTAWLPPSRMVLKENTDERFDYFKRIGITNLKELITILKKKERVFTLSALNLFAGDYLVILLRELNSFLPKPNKINEFTIIPPEIAERLENEGIKDTKAYFERVLTPEKRKNLAETTGIKEEDIILLTHLTDLSRIKWVGVTFAQMLYNIGVDTVEKASMADPEELHKKINQINKEKNIYKGNIGLNDIRIFVDAAKEVPSEIEY